MSRNNNACKDFIIETHANQLMQLPENQRAFNQLVGKKDTTAFISKLINTGTPIFQDNYELVQNYSLLIEDFSKGLKVKMTIQQINFIAEQMFYPSLMHFQKKYNIKPSKTDLLKCLSHTTIQKTINSIFKTKYPIEHTTYISEKIIDHLTIFNLDNNKNSAIKQGFHLISKQNLVIKKITSLMENESQLTEHKYFIITKRIFSYLQIINATTNARDEIANLAILLEKQLKLLETVNLAIANSEEIYTRLFSIDPLLAMNHLAMPISSRQILINIANTKTSLQKIKKKTSGILSSPSAIRRAYFSMFFFAQLLGINKRNKHNNFDGNPIEQFLFITFDLTKTDQVLSKARKLYSEYINNQIISDHVINLINNCTNSDLDFELADQSFASFLTENIFS
jgi:hypothetical protein